MPLARRFLIFSLVLLLAACSPRGAITMFPQAEGVGASIPVFVGTTRLREPGGGFGSGRGDGLSFHRFDISVPPAHQPGRIEWPRGAPDPASDFLTTDATDYTSAAAFSAALRTHLRRQPGHRREVVVYVHGFNNNFSEGLYRLAQLGNDFRIPATAVHYSWPSAGNPLGYAYDRDSMLIARDGLEELLRTIRAAGGEPALLVGHSLGGLLIMETLRQIAIGDRAGVDRLVQGVILISPDIDVQVFRSQAARIGRLPQPFAIFTSQRDRVLQLAARLTGQRNRLGNVDDLEQLAELEVTVIDVTGYSEGGTGHFTTANSPALIALFDRLAFIEAAFKNDRSGQTGLLPGLVLTVQNATQIILTPALDLVQ